MANRYSQTANLFLTSIFYTPLLPAAPLIACLGMAFSYCIDKYIILRRHKKPEQLSGMMGLFFANQIPYYILIYTISNMVFIGAIWSNYEEDTDIAMYPDVANAPFAPTLLVGAVILYIILPVRTLLNCCFNQDEVLENASKYADLYQKFFTDYDRENPVTHKQGVIRLLETRIANAEGEEKQRLEAEKKNAIFESVVESMQQYNDRRQAQNMRMKQDYAPQSKLENFFAR